MFYSFKNEKTYLSIKATTKACRNYIGNEKNGELSVFVTSIPENNSANKSIVKLLSKVLGIAKSKIYIISGKKSRNKKICITEKIEENILKKLQ